MTEKRFFEDFVQYMSPSSLQYYRALYSEPFFEEQWADRYSRWATNYGVEVYLDP